MNNVNRLKNTHMGVTDWDLNITFYQVTGHKLATNEFLCFLIRVGGSEKSHFFVKKTNCLGTFATDSASQLDVLGHDGHTLGVDGTQVGIFEQTYKVSFAGLLKSHDGGALESEISLEVLSDFSDQTLEWQFADQKLCALLVTTDLTESHSSWPVTMGFLHSSGGWGALTGSLGGQLFPWGFASSGFPGCLLSSGHVECLIVSV